MTLLWLFLRKSLYDRKITHISIRSSNLVHLNNILPETWNCLVSAHRSSIEPKSNMTVWETQFINFKTHRLTGSQLKTCVERRFYNPETQQKQRHSQTTLWSLSQCDNGASPTALEWWNLHLQACYCRCRGTPRHQSPRFLELSTGCLLRCEGVPPKCSLLSLQRRSCCL